MVKGKWTCDSKWTEHALKLLPVQELCRWTMAWAVDSGSTFKTISAGSVALWQSAVNGSLLEWIMVAAERARELLSMHGIVQPQPPDDWTGIFPLPPSVERFFQQVGPADITIEDYGNPFFLPRLAALWEFQAGYRWNGLTGQPIEGWDDDWLVVADQGGDPFILSRASGSVLHAVHGSGVWAPAVMFADLNTMAACLGHLGAVVVSAGEAFSDEDCLIRPECHEQALAGLQQLLGVTSEAESVLERLGWGYEAVGQPPA
jgi:hypothetical protein